jgi:hypothetical protein
MVYLFGMSVEWVWGAILLGSVVTGVLSAVWLRAGMAQAARGSLRVEADAGADPHAAAAPIG